MKTRFKLESITNTSKSISYRLRHAPVVEIDSQALFESV